jgi:Holliday junction resolvasome RuvABC endonuclease subunit
VNVLGLDLSLNAPGFCPAPLVAHSMTMTAKEGDRRLVRTGDATEHYLRQRRYDLAAIEAVPGYMTNTAALERVHGVVRERLCRHGVPFVYISPSSLKLFATGSGSADKQAMIAAAIEIGAAPKDDNQADAVWLGEIGSTLLGEHRRPLLGYQVKALEAMQQNKQSGIRKCRHGHYCLHNGTRWLHPMGLDVCDKPPK